MARQKINPLKPKMTERQKRVFIENQRQIDLSSPNSEYYYDLARETDDFEQEMYWWSAVFAGLKKENRYSKNDVAYQHMRELFGYEHDARDVIYLGESGDHTMSEVVVTTDKDMIHNISHVNKEVEKQKQNPIPHTIVHERRTSIPVHEMDAKELVGFNFLVSDILVRCKRDRAIKALACVLVDNKLDNYLREESFSDPEKLFKYIKQIYTQKKAGTYNDKKFVGGEDNGNRYWQFEQAIKEIQSILTKSVL